MKKFVLIIAAITVLWVQVAGADERILTFDSVIKVMPDGSMMVTEAIKVKAEGKKIRRGIYRDFPTKYEDRYGANYIVDFEVIAVRRDGEPEGYFTKKLRNGVRTYMGRKNVHLKPGEYTYTITYRTNRQLGFFDTHDELYWNVTGNGWSFPIDEASATVILPQDIPIDSSGLVAYTGRQGARGTDYDAQMNDQNLPQFFTTRSLRPFEGLTIAVSWPKGYIKEPTLATRIGWFVDDNPGFSTGASGLILLLAYYLFAWNRVGRDPQAGVIFPHYEPPEHFSPASMRFIKRMGYDHKTFATALVNLAVNGHVTIHDEDDTYTIEKHVNPKNKMAPGEKTLLKKLLRGTKQKLDNKHHSRISKAIKAHKKSLENDYEKVYFLTNSAWFYFGALISVVIFLATVYQIADSFIFSLFGMIFTAVFGLFMGKALLRISTVAPQLIRKTGVGTAGGVIGFVIALAVLGFVGTFIFQFTAIIVQDPASRIGLILFVALILVINGVFYQLMKAPTKVGRSLLNKIEGFAEYLTVAEEDDLRLRNPPKKTPQLFEKYLPYAMALGVEDIWGEKFTAVLKAARRDGSYTQPGWYHGSNFGSFSRPGAFANTMASSLAASAASAATAPGSSSGGGFGGGGGGGGSSGGGGGGGGGGGW